METMRCPWAKSPLEIAYHDQEWGRPNHDEAHLFEMLILEGMQAGLSWSLILNKRESMRAAFDGFAPEKLAAYSDEKLAALLENPGVIRNRRKLNMLRVNARAYLELCKTHGGLDAFLWPFTQGQVLDSRPEKPEDIPAETAISRQMSEALRKLGFQFVGPVVCYSLMQSVGLVNDHLAHCPARRAAE